MTLLPVVSKLQTKLQVVPDDVIGKIKSGGDCSISKCGIVIT